MGKSLLLHLHQQTRLRTGLCNLRLFLFTFCTAETPSHPHRTAQPRRLVPAHHLWCLSDRPFRSSRLHHAPPRKSLEPPPLKTSLSLCFCLSHRSLSFSGSSP